MDPIALGTLALSAAGAVVGVEVLKKLIMDKVFPPKDFNPKDRVLLHEMHAEITSMRTLVTESYSKVIELHSMHDVKDNDGVPLVYVPRSWGKTQEETLNVSKDIAFSQRETAKALESVTRVIERLHDKIEALERRRD